ncbi:hypothetical protein [Cupriavidus sp. SIMBA_020]|uniref:hypothetical protein n=1 Tax=Cupriavidus sp. SIMBA_020 TaxID=3085766 RepID=UPI00397C4B32
MTSNNTSSIRVAVDYEDVVFKFECFGLMIDSSVDDVGPNAKNMIEFDGCQVIKCLFRFEWERPAQGNEVPAGWEKFVRQRGREADIQRTASSACVSMVGLIFAGLAPGSPTVTLVVNDDEPGTMRLLVTRDEILSFIRECEIVALEEVQKWVDKIDRQS